MAIPGDSNTLSYYSSIRLRIRSDLINKLTLIVAAAAILAAPAAVAEQSGPFPGSPINPATINTGERVEELYEQGDYERAHFIYRNELAPIGDKYAQYMVGFMILTGTGVQEDPIIASAWYRLAAERANPDFLAVRDQLVQSFSEPDRVRSDYYYLQLRREYSDAVLLLELVREDVNQMFARTGSRLSGRSGTVTIVDPRAGTSVSGDQYFRQLKRRIEARLKFLAEQLGQSDLATDAERVDVDLLEERVMQYVEKINDR